MKKYLFIIITIGITIINLNCSEKWLMDNHSLIMCINNSDKDVYVSYSRLYPDTLFDEYFQSYHNSNRCKVSSKSTSGSPLSLGWSGSWDDYFKNKDTLIVFFIDAEKLDSICINNEKIQPTEEFYVENNKLIILRMDFLTLSDLNQSNWTITYP